MKNSSQLELLGSVDATSDNSYLLSWVTDFSIPNKASTFIGSYNAILNWPSFDTDSGGPNVSILADPESQDKNANLLEIDVAIFDVIERQCQASQQQGLINDFEKYSEWWSMTLDLPKISVRTGEDGIEVLSRTLIANRLDEHSTTGPSDILEQFRPFVRYLLTPFLLICVDIRKKTKEDFWPLYAACKVLAETSALGSRSTDVELNTAVDYRMKLNENKTISEKERERLLNEFYKKNVALPDNSYSISLDMTCLGRRLARTKFGLLCLVPESSQVGDMACFVRGGRIPFVLRRGSKEDRYKLIGGSYIHGFMDGEISIPNHKVQRVYLE